MKKILLFALLAWCLGTADAGNVSIIPQPVSVVEKSGQFKLERDMVLSYEKGLEQYAEYLQGIISRSTGWDLKLVADKKKADIVLKTSPAEITHKEGYRLDVTWIWSRVPTHRIWRIW